MSNRAEYFHNPNIKNCSVFTSSVSFRLHEMEISQRLGNNAEWWTWGDTLVTNRYLSPPVGSVITGQIKCFSKSNQICWLCDYRLITFYQGDGYQSLLRGPAYPLRSQSCSVPYLSRGLPNLFSQEFGGITFHKTLTKWQVNDDISPALLW